mmetsp:Transcript_45357/g.60215  ORF Transcript_45357/g.60215 Transcript_45357/m.60215 type:complete len:99 (+) Transcript_45357:33-329(+)
MESLLGRALSSNEKALAISVAMGIIVTLVTREYLQDVMDDNRELLTRTRTSQRAISTDVMKQELLAEAESSDGTYLEDASDAEVKEADKAQTCSAASA